MLVLLGLAAFGTAPAQRLLRGVVLDAEKNSPVPKASVFLNNTSVGTTATDEGRFEITVPAGKYELVVSSVGFNTHLQTITVQDVPDFLTIRLAAKAPELEAVVIEPYLKDGWAQWGRFFLENFIGTSELADDCQILNKDLLRFRFSKKQNKLSVSAGEPLVIENKALGYRIRYQLETFLYDFQTQFVLYIGYPFFEPLQARQRKQQRWAEKRREVYYGSTMHFMRSLYRNTLVQEGFEVRRLQKFPNLEKQRVRELYRTRRAPPATKSLVSSGNRFVSDSTGYYESVLRQPDVLEKIGREVLTGDSIAFAIDSVTAGLSFPDYLYVHYLKGQVPLAYKRLYPTGAHAMLSYLQLLTDQPLSIQANGMYYNPVDVVMSGYWGWSEKMATMLPFDYKPQE